MMGQWARSVAVVALALGAWAVESQQKTGAKPAAAAVKLDLGKPDDALRAYRKLVVSLKDETPTVIWFQGRIYSRVAGERDRLLFSYQAFNVRQAKTLSEPGRGYGYRQVSRELLLYTDPQTGEVLRTWKNPWTGKDVEVLHVANDPVNQQPLFAQGGPRGPFKWEPAIKEGKGFYAIEVPLLYPNPLGGEYQDFVGGTYQAIEMFGFFFDEKELLGPGDDSQTSVSWARTSQWLPWMEMGARPGWLQYTGHGQRVSSFELLPEVLKKEVAASYPDYRTPPPVDDTRPNETSWTYFKKKIDEKRKAGPAR
jgi:hypothetical protein